MTASQSQQKYPRRAQIMTGWQQKFAEKVAPHAADIALADCKQMLTLFQHQQSSHLNLVAIAARQRKSEDDAVKAA